MQTQKIKIVQSLTVAEWTAIKKGCVLSPLPGSTVDGWG